MIGRNSPQGLPDNKTPKMGRAGPARLSGSLQVVVTQTLVPFRSICNK